MSGCAEDDDRHPAIVELDDPIVAAVVGEGLLAGTLSWKVTGVG